MIRPAWHMRLGVIGMLLMAALSAAPVSATQPVVPTCDMRYPALQRMRMEALLKVLRKGSIDEGQCAVGHLSRYGVRAIPALEIMLQSEHEDARQLAVAGLSALGSLALPVVPKLESALDDPSEEVRWRVLESFVVIKPRSPVLTADLLRRLARSQNGSGGDDAMLAAIASLGKLPPEALQSLTKTLAAIPDDDRPAIDGAIDAMSHVQSPQAVVALTELVGRGDTERSARAASVVGPMGGRALPDLAWRFALANSDAERDNVLPVLRYAWHVATTPGLTEYYRTDWVQLLRQLASADPVVRSGALDALDSIVPAFSALSRGTFPGSRPAYGLCEALRVLESDLDTHPAMDTTERQLRMHMAAALRATQPYPVVCVFPVY